MGILIFLHGKSKAVYYNDISDFNHGYQQFIYSSLLQPKPYWWRFLFNSSSDKTKRKIHAIYKTVSRNLFSSRQIYAIECVIRFIKRQVVTLNQLYPVFIGCRNQRRSIFLTDDHNFSYLLVIQSKRPQHIYILYSWR